LKPKLARKRELNRNQMPSHRHHHKVSGKKKTGRETNQPDGIIKQGEVATDQPGGINPVATDISLDQFSRITAKPINGKLTENSTKLASTGHLLATLTDSSTSEGVVQWWMKLDRLNGGDVSLGVASSDQYTMSTDARGHGLGRWMWNISRMELFSNGVVGKPTLSHSQDSKPWLGDIVGCVVDMREGCRRLDFFTFRKPQSEFGGLQQVGPGIELGSHINDTEILAVMPAVYLSAGNSVRIVTTVELKELVEAQSALRAVRERKKQLRKEAALEAEREILEQKQQAEEKQERQRQERLESTRKWTAQKRENEEAERKQRAAQLTEINKQRKEQLEKEASKYRHFY
jgi:hypothetical protein